MSSWDPEPAQLRDGETRDGSAHARRTNRLTRDGRREFARQELEGDYHRCSICDETFDEIQELADHDCEVSHGD